MQRFNTLLNKPELNALSVHNQQTQVAQKLWEAIAPDNLAQFSQASSIKNQQFTIHANNNAVAAKIKLLSPNLLLKLQKQGCEVTSIRVKVQVKSSPLPRQKHLKKLSPVAAAHLQLLSEKLSGTALGEALIKLAKNAD